MHLSCAHCKLTGGQANWKQVCGEFWQPLSAAAQSTADISVMDVIDVLDAVLEPHLFPTTVRLVAAHPVASACVPSQRCSAAP